MRIRLDRWLSALAVGSRSEGKEMIRRGRIGVNGETARDPGMSVDPDQDRLTVDGRETDGRLVRHVVMNKPAGLLTAARDRKQPTVMDLLPPVYASLSCMPVGRLDKDTTGVLLLTTDGEMNHRLLSPARHVDKVYRARVAGRIGEEAIRAFAAGLDLGDFTAMPARLEILGSGEEESLAEVTVAEGKFHQVKRMFEAVGHPVYALDRIRFGPLGKDSALREGAWRELREEEVRALREAAGMNPDE